MKENPHLYVINSDKGQKTVIIHEDIYKEKMNEHLNDKNTYIPINNTNLNYNKILENKNNKLIQHLADPNQITMEEKRHLEIRNSIPPRIYAAIKVHKQNYPIRPIVSTINTTTYKLSKFLNNIISTANNDNYNIKNAFEFKDKISGMKLDKDDIMSSFDVVALYTNVNQDEAIESVMKRWNIIKKNTNIKKREFRELLEFCIKDNSFFMYDNIFYRQKYGLPMGSSLSGTLAGFVLDDLLDKIFNTSTPKLLNKYVDDILIIDKEENIKKYFETLNLSHNTLKFTMEMENDQKIPFLDLLLIRNNDKIFYDWYKKPISSGRILNWFSNHPLKMKINIGISFANRVLTLSHPKFHQENYKKIITTLKTNNYSYNIIKRIIHKVKISLIFHNKIEHKTMKSKNL